MKNKIKISKTIRNTKNFADILNYSAWLRTSHISRHIALTELYRKTIGLPGSIAEFGVWRGSSFFLLAKLIEIFNSSQHETSNLSNRHLYGFDTFEGFKGISEQDDSNIEYEARQEGGLKFDNKIFLDAFDYLKKESKISDRIHLVKGDVVDTFDQFIKQNPGVRFCLINMDMDIYKPTKFVLEKILTKVVRGGIIIFDEYGYPEWPGETQAVDEFIKNNDFKLKSFSWTYGPSAYCIVE